MSAVAAERAVSYAERGVLANVLTKSGRLFQGVRLSTDSRGVKVLTGRRGRPPILPLDEISKVTRA